MIDILFSFIAGFGAGALLLIGYVLHHEDKHDEELVQAGYEKGLVVGRQWGER